MLSVFCITAAMALEDEGTWCERAVKVHPSPSLKEALLANCDDAEKNETIREN